MRILKEVCSIPTAPFCESRVIQYAEQFVAARPRLRLRRDPGGNVLIELPGRRHSLPRWVFAAHMDHPAFVARRMIDGTHLAAEFRGNVLAACARRARVRFFQGDREIVATIQSATSTKTGMLRGATLLTGKPIARGTVGLFDQGEGRVRGTTFYSRAIDDLGGAAAALAMLDELHRNPPPSTIAVLLTRAEEVGFVGAMAASMRPTLLRRSDRIIAIECSAAQPYAPHGKGPIIRVGDKTSVFNSSLLYFLGTVAGNLAKRDRKFQCQRALMPGGTCEATVYDIYGFCAASICVALGNYHNMDRAKNTMGPEYINADDWRNMVRLFVALARRGHEYSGRHELLRNRLERRFARYIRLLAAIG